MGLGEQRAHLGLLVGGEAGVGHALDFGGSQVAVGTDGDVLVALFDHRADAGQLVQDRLEIFSVHISQLDLATAHGGSDGERAGDQPVGQDVVPGSVELLAANNFDDAGAFSAYPRAHRLEQLDQVQHFGLARGVHDGGGSFGKTGGHYQVFGAGVAGVVKVDAGPLEPGWCVGDVAGLLGLDGGAHDLEALYVDVNRADPQIAAAGMDAAEFAEATEQRTGDQEGGAHLVYDLGVGFEAGDVVGGDAD